MIKKLKLLCSLLLIACLVLPLSTCQREPLPIESAKNIVPAAVEHYVVSQSGNLVRDYLPALLFVLPLLLVLISWKQVYPKLRYQLFEFFDSLLILVFVYLHTYFGKLALGGYLALVAAGLFILLVVLDIVGGRRHRHQATHSQT